MIDWEHPELAVSTQCSLIGLPRSTLYYESKPEDALNLEFMREIDEIYTEFPFYGYRKILHVLQRRGYEVNHKRVARLMREMGIAAVSPARKPLGLSAPGNVRYPYVLKGIKVERVNQVWGADITYIRMRYGWMYLVAILDWYSRYVLAWELSNTLDADFCAMALERALEIAVPEISNTDQGSQFGSSAWVGPLKARGVVISMDGRGRAFDNIFTERLWRTVKYEEVYLHDYEDGKEARANLSRYFPLYNDRRIHQSLGYRTPAEVYFG